MSEKTVNQKNSWFQLQTPAGIGNLGVIHQRIPFRLEKHDGNLVAAAAADWINPG